MTHLPILPFLIPLAAAILILAFAPRDPVRARPISIAAAVLTAGVALLLVLRTADGTVFTYALGNWPAPFGILLVADRLAALMVATTAAVALPALLAATGGADTRGRHFHVLFQMQVAGINGAFLTGDLFNLFVFFEVLLIASYGLLVHGGGAARARAGLHYVALNLTGSTLFLFALALLYGILGTLNLADVAARLPLVPEADQALLRTGLILLLVVFALKAALLPLSFWLPHAYGAACPPVAALFAIMTKVGIYALLRVDGIALAASPFTADLLDPWLVPLALATIVMGTVGVLAAERLAMIVANVVLISTGTLLVAIGLGGPTLMAAAIFYLPHTTLVTAALFLLTGHIAAARGGLEDRLERGPIEGDMRLVGLAYLGLAVAASGLPPLSGFLGKLMLLTASPATFAGYATWAALILSGFAVALVFARAASTLFWESAGAPEPPPLPPAEDRLALDGGRLPGLALALALAASVTLGAAPLAGLAQRSAEQLAARAGYIEAALLPTGPIERERRP